MNSKQKQDKINSINQLIPITHAFPEFQLDAIDERTILKREIQSECNHEYINCGDIEICLECNQRKMT
jgi:hypothetical protein